MEFSLQTLFVIPILLGLLGFVEPCTIGGHLVFLNSQKNRSRMAKTKAVFVFVITRSLMAGLFGALITFAGQNLISLQTGLWLFFGMIYVTLGLFFMSGKGGWVKQRIDFAPKAWKTAQNPLVLGLAFGFNIPACAAPILFGLLGLAATTGSVMAGFFMMFLFGLFLSLPLVPFVLVPALSTRLNRLAVKLQTMRWIIGAVFIALGLWSIWFGLYVNPEDWSNI